MKILHIISNGRWTGAAEPVVNLALGLKARGHKVYFDCIAGGSLGKRASVLGLEPLRKFNLRPNQPCGMLADIFKLRDFIRQEQIEILHMHLSHDHWIGALAKHLAAWPGDPVQPVALVRTIHNTAKVWGDPLHRLLFKRTDFVATLSQRAGNALRERLHLPEDKLGIVYGALDRERFLASARPPVSREAMGLAPGDIAIGLASHLHHNRGHREALSAYMQLRTAIPSAKLVFLGETDNHYYKFLKAEVQRLGLERDVLFWVDAEWEEWPKHMALLDLVLYLASGSEESARAVLEAMALAKPVVALDVGILPEMVSHGQSGLLIPSRKPEFIAQAVGAILCEPEKAAGMGQYGSRVLSQRFLVPYQAERMEEIYLRVRGEG